MTDSRDIRSLTADELDQLAYSVDAKVAEARAQKKAVQDERDRRAIEERAKLLTNDLTDEQREALLQVVQAQGVEKTGT